MTAIGGRDAWMKIKSRVSIGTVDVPAYNISGTVEVHQKAPDKLLSQAVIGGQAYRHGSDGTMTWSDDPQNGIKEETGTAAAASKRESDFYHPIDLKKIYAKLTVTGTEKVNGHDTYVVEAVTVDGTTDKLYFDTTSGLLVRSVSHHPAPDGSDAIYTSDIEDYQRCGWDQAAVCIAPVERTGAIHDHIHERKAERGSDRRPVREAETGVSGRFAGRASQKLARRCIIGTRHQIEGPSMSACGNGIAWPIKSLAI